MTALSTEQSKIIATAESEYGVGEQPPGSNRGPCEKFLPQWKRGEYARLDKERGHLVAGDPWCAWSATWVLHEALGRHVLDRQIGGVYQLAETARRHGLWLALEPGPLDVDMALVCYPGCLVVLLDQPLEHGHSDGHTGIITGVAPDGVEISTAEGNTGNAYRAGRRSLRAPRMRGIVLTLGLAPLTADWPRGLRALFDVSGVGTR
jgi:hypothetical protein